MFEKIANNIEEYIPLVNDHTILDFNEQETKPFLRVTFAGITVS